MLTWRCGPVTEVQDCQVEKIHDHHDLSDPELRVDPQHDEG